MSTERRLAVSVAAALILVVVGGAPLAQQYDHPADPHQPPAEGKFLRGHWTPYDSPDPEAFPEDSLLHIIVTGDTLWDLSTRYLGDPWLWPQLWDQNRYILDSHWIYPGDPLLIPAPPTVIADAEPEPAPEPEPEPEPEPDDVPPEQPVAVSPILQPGQPVVPRQEPMMPEMLGPELLPVASETDIYCSSYLVPAVEATDLMIADREDTYREMLTSMDVVFLNAGLSDDIVPGQEFAIFRAGEEVHHPATRERAGQMVLQLGRLRVIAAQENTSTAVIQKACGLPIRVGDWLKPFAERSVPLSAGVSFDPYGMSIPEVPDGFIISGQENDGAEFGSGDLVEIDVSGEQVAPGDYLIVYRDFRHEHKFGSPRTITDTVTPEMLAEAGPYPVVLGQMVVLRVQGNLATGKIVRSLQEMAVGDKLTRM